MEKLTFCHSEAFSESRDCHGNQRFPRNDVIASIAKQSRAFSLIELLISLIIISLLIAAFTPLITKKMKASDITVGSFGGKNNGDGTTIERNVTRDDCTRLNAVYVSAEETGDKPICVMKYNVGDGAYNETFDDVQVCTAGSNCTVENGTSENVTKEDLTPTCWQGTTAGNCDAKYGGYSGCTRTVCNWTGAEKMCSNLGSGWRLPTIEELESFTNDKYSSSKLSSNGLMFCDASTSTTTAPMCNNMTGGCKGSFNSNCYSQYLWSSSLDAESLAQGRRLKGVWYPFTYSLGYAFSARCVLDTVTETIKEVEKEVEVEKPTTPAEAPSEEFCAQFDAMFVPAKWSGSVDMCVTKYNIGDITAEGSGPSVAQGISILSVSTSNCSSGNCCWKGKTTASCSVEGNGSGENQSAYSGCNRTVCGWNATIMSCLNWAPKGMPSGFWRLPTNAELAVWATNIDEISKNQGKNGLQLCDEGSSSNGSAYCKHTQVCLGSNSNWCMPGRIWTNEPVSSGHYVRYLSGGTFNNTWETDPTGASGRCVYDGKAGTTISFDTDKQKICDKYNSFYVPAKYTGSEDLCITKYNVGDDGGPTFSNYPALGITFVGVSGTSCSSGKCCWQGQTTGMCTDGGNGNSTYSGCNRTVCGWNASNILCNNWNPDGTEAGKWRLPRQSELAMIATNINVLSVNRGTNGLQLCDEAISGGSAYCKHTQVCLGSNSNWCMPGRIWTNEPVSSGHYVRYLSGGTFNNTWETDPTGASGRCVSSEVLKE